MSKHRIEATAKRRALGYWLVGGGLAVGYAMMRGSEWQGGIELHTLTEGLASVIALMVGAMALVRFYSRRDNAFLFIGCGFLVAAVLDTYHAVITSSFLTQFLTEQPSLISWSWVAARLFLSVLMCLSWFVWFREQRLGKVEQISERSVYLVIGAFLIVSLGLLAIIPLPRTYFPDFVFHRPEELVPALFLLVALVGYLRKGKWRNDVFEHWLVLSLIVGFIEQAVFMSLSKREYDMEFNAAHLLITASYICTLIGLILSTHSILRESEISESSMRGTAKILDSIIQNFPGGISVFSADLKLVAFNQAFVDLLEFPQDLIKIGIRYEDIIRFNANRGEYGEGDTEKQVQERVDLARKFEPHYFDRTRPTGEIIEIHGTPMPGGGFMTTYVDITARKQAMAEIKKRDALLHGIVTTVVDGVVTMDDRGLIASFNPAAERIFGYRADDVIGKNVSLLAAGYDRDNHESYVRSFLKTSRRKMIGLGREVEGRRADGCTFPMELAVKEMVVSGKRKFVGTIRDITERKKAEDALRETSRIQQLLHRISVATNEANTVEDAIQAGLNDVCAHIGWPVGHAYVLADDAVSTLVSSGLWYLEDPDRFEVFRELTAGMRCDNGAGLPDRVLVKGKPEWIEDLTKDPGFRRGKLAPDAGLRSAFAVPVFEQKKMVAVIEFFSTEPKARDDSLLELMMQIGTLLGRAVERKRYQNELKISEARLQAILDYSPTEIHIKDAAGRYILVNRETERLFGLTGEEIIGKTPHEIFPKDTADYFLDHDAMVANFRRKAEQEEEWVTKDGSRTFLTIKFPILGADNQVEAIGAVGTDITDRKLAEKELLSHRDHLKEMVMERTAELERRSEQLEQALAKEKELNELQRQFVSMVSHEFRTPLAIIDGTVQRMARRGDRLTPDDIQQRTERIRRAVKRATMLIDSTLSVARLDAGSIAMSPKTMDLAGLIADICTRQRDISPTCEILVDVDGITTPIFADIAMLDQVFTNLLSNAAKYSPDDSPIEVKGWMDGEQVVVSVLDYGLGIPENDLLRLFERFFRAGTSTGIAGTGIGLNLVKQLVEMHGGSIEVESVEGEGSTFTVRLPIKLAEDVSARGPAGPTSPVAA